jgi:hypothetical protein
MQKPAVSSILLVVVQLAVGVTVEAQQPERVRRIGVISSNPSTPSESGVGISSPSEVQAQSKQPQAPAPSTRIESPPLKVLRPVPLRLPPDPITPSEPEKTTIFGIQVPAWHGEVFEIIFRFIVGILLVLAGSTVYFWRKDAQRKKREKDYIETVERDWGSAEILSTALKHMEHLRDQSRNWTEEQWKIYRENDVRQNAYDYDQLWDSWKRYERRRFEPETHALLASTWTKDEVVELMNFYVRETKARWQLLREREHEKTSSAVDEPD